MLLLFQVRSLFEFKPTIFIQKVHSDTAATLHFIIKPKIFSYPKFVIL